jgi:hypothetical protein
MAHGRSEAFDGEDARMMQLLANFAAMGFRQQRQQKELMEKERAAAAAAMANDLAHKINNYSTSSDESALHRQRKRFTVGARDVSRHGKTVSFGERVARDTFWYKIY